MTYDRIKTKPPTRDMVAFGVFRYLTLKVFFVLSVFLSGLIILPLSSAFGVVVGSTDTSEFDETGSPWYGMNWDYIYATGAGTSVAIDGWHLISASHYSLSNGMTFTAGDDTFAVVSHQIPPVDTGETVPPDMQIVEVRNVTRPGVPLPGYYELYGGSFTLGQSAVVVGTGFTGYDYGTSYSEDISSARLKRWGTNEVERFRLGPSTTGRKLADSTDADTDPNWSTMTFRMDYNSYDMDHEAGLAEHDSGGGVFILDDGVWKLGGLCLYRTPTTIGGDRYDENYFASVPYYIDWISGTLPEFVLGDANLDGVVSAADYSAVQAFFGNTGGDGLLGDANGDGVVSAADYACIQANFGNVAAASNAGVAAVPEPATISVLIIGGLALLRRRGQL